MRVGAILRSKLGPFGLSARSLFGTGPHCPDTITDAGTDTDAYPDTDTLAFTSAGATPAPSDSPTGPANDPPVLDADRLQVRQRRQGRVRRGHNSSSSRSPTQYSTRPLTPAVPALGHVPPQGELSSAPASLA